MNSAGGLRYYRSSGRTAAADRDADLRIKSVSCRKILNSHVDFTNEFIIEFDSGEVGVGSSPQGETISIYEDRAFMINPEKIIRMLKEDLPALKPLNQEVFDSYLQKKIPLFGRNNVFALSLAFCNAAGIPEICRTGGRGDERPGFPRLCLNVLNGGRHAYTNPVLSDFPEYLLVANHGNLEKIIMDQNSIQKRIRERLLNLGKTLINGNPVNTFGPADNRQCIELLLEVLESLDLSDFYDVMIDASAGDLWTENRYRFSLTDNSVKTGAELCRYWLQLIEDYPVRYLEDPFHELDYDSWKRLTAEQNGCRIIGDNFYSSDAGRIEEGALNGYTHGAIVKPNQAGTVTDTIKAIESARMRDQIVIASHRSISTESTFLSTISCLFHIGYIKIGPLNTDYSSVIRLNELMRMTGVT